MLKVQITVKGQLDQEWSQRLDGLTIQHPLPNETMIQGTVPDYPALYGILSRLRDLGIGLISVMSEEVDQEQGNEGPPSSFRQDSGKP